MKDKKTYKAYDAKLKKKVSVVDPKAVKTKNGVWGVKGKSSESGNTVFAMVGKKKPIL